MPSISADIADALKTDIDAESWPVTLTTYREYMAPISRVDLGATNRVSIFPFSFGVAGVSRGSVERTHGVAIVLRSATAPDATAAIDARIETLELIAARYLKETITYTGSDKASPFSVEPILGDQLYDVDRLGESLTFQGGFFINYNTRN